MTTHKKAEPEEKRSHHKKPGSEPEPADDGSDQASDPAVPMAAHEPAGGLPDETSAEETAARDKAVRAQVQDFVENLPPGAEEGLYSATAHDRWSNGPYQSDIPDGTYCVHGEDWFVTFRAGRLYSAMNRGRASAADEAAAILIDYPR
jgi:hypothetical protein